MTVFIVTIVIASALLIGAAWGAYGHMSEKLEGFLIALAGGALIVSLMLELIMPANEIVPVGWAMGFVGIGAATFTLLDTWIDKKFGKDSGGGLLAAITLDGVPENLALGVALIGAGAMQVAALAASIFLSNLPEAAGGAKEMQSSGMSKNKSFLTWLLTAILLSLATIIGYFTLDSAPENVLAYIKCFAAGAIVSSLATEVFPKAFKEDHNMTGIAVAIGLIGAFLLYSLGE